MKKILKLTLTIAFLISLNSFAVAQDKKEISEEKQNLIAELIEITQTNKQILEITDNLLESMERTYPLVLERSIRKDSNLTQIQQEEISRKATESFKSFNKKFRERLPKEIDYGQYVKDTVFPLYDKFFTEKELADLIAFYKTETGKKVVVTMPKLFAESTKLAETILLPKVLKLVDKILKEEIKVLEDSLKKNEGK